MAEDFYSSEMQKDMAAFNSAITFLNRLNYWIYQSEVAYMTDDLITWRKSLNILYKEVECHFKEEEKKIIDDIITQLQPAYSKFLSFNNMNSITGNPIPSSITGTVGKLLNQLDLEIRRVIDRCGFLMPDKQDPRHLF